MNEGKKEERKKGGKEERKEGRGGKEGEGKTNLLRAVVSYNGGHV